jgi:hypothetical protein
MTCSKARQSLFDLDVNDGAQYLVLKHAGYTGMPAVL